MIPSALPNACGKAQTHPLRKEINSWLRAGYCGSKAKPASWRQLQQRHATAFTRWMREVPLEELVSALQEDNRPLYDAIVRKHGQPPPR